MRLIRSVLVFLLLIACLHEAGAQRIFVVQNTGRFKSFKYFEGDEIVLKTIGKRKKISGTLEGMTDSSLFIGLNNVVMLKDIKSILRHRFWFGRLSVYSAIAGVGYTAIEATNSLINREPTIVSKNTLMISGGLLAFSAALLPFHNRHINIGRHWRVMVINMDLEGDVPNPFQR